MTGKTDARHGLPMRATAFSTPIRMLIYLYRPHEIFNCMCLRQACNASTPSLTLTIPGQDRLARQAHPPPPAPAARCFLRFSGALPTPRSAASPLPCYVPCHPGPFGRQDGSRAGGRRRNGFWPLFLPLQKAPCPRPSLPPRIPPSPLKPPTGLHSLARPRTWEPAVWGRRWGRMRCGWRSCRRRYGRWGWMWWMRAIWRGR